MDAAFEATKKALAQKFPETTEEKSRKVKKDDPNKGTLVMTHTGGKLSGAQHDELSALVGIEGVKITSKFKDAKKELEVNVTLSAGAAGAGPAKKAVSTTAAPGDAPALTRVSDVSAGLVDAIFQQLADKKLLDVGAVDDKVKAAMVEDVIFKLQQFKNQSYHKGYQANMQGSNVPVRANIFGGSGK